MMARTTIAVVDVEIRKENTDAVLQFVAERLGDIYKVIMEYVKNSLDSAAGLIDELGRLPHPIVVKVDISTKTGEIRILDNCGGMTEDGLKKVASNAFTAAKHVKGKVQRHGIGIHTFRAYFKKLTIRTKRDGRLLEMSLKRGQEHITGNHIDEIMGEEFPYKHGTEVILSELEPVKGRPYEVMPDKLRADLEHKFGLALANPHVQIKITTDGSNETTCRCPQAYGSRHINVQQI